MKAADTAAALVARIHDPTTTPFEIARSSFALAEIVPELLEEITRLQTSLLTAKITRKTIDTSCLHCRKQFKVYKSQLKGGQACGKYCSQQCYQTGRKLP